MEPIYHQYFDISDNYVDCFGRLKSSMMLFFAQEVAGRHFTEISMDYDSLAQKGMFWAIIRQKVQVTRLPLRGERIRVETWPMPTTRVAYPRSVVAYDEAGNECFRSITLWVLMDLTTRAMILPGKSGISVSGTLRGGELASPGSLVPKVMTLHRERTVCFTDLDRNCHMNNTRYLDWIDDLLTSGFQQRNHMKELTVCYLNEAREGQKLDLSWEFGEDGSLQVEASRKTDDKTDRVFAAKILYETGCSVN